MNFGVFNVLVTVGYIEWIPYLQLELVYGFGPSLYLYTKSLTDESFRLQKSDWWHFVLPFMEFVYNRTSLFRDGAISLSEHASSKPNVLFQIVQWGGILSVISYLICTIYLLINYKRWLKNHYSSLENRGLSWLQKPILIYTLFWIIWIPVRVTDILVFDDIIRPYYFNMGFLCLAVTTCWIGFKGYLTTQTNTVGFLHNQTPEHSPKIAQSDLLKIAKTLKQKMSVEKYYLDSDLTLFTFSKHVGYSKKEISKALNSCLHLNFHEFVNKYRVEAFKENIQREEYAHLSMLGVAFESGFGSKSSFNLVFKANTGLTPKKYKEQLSNNKS